jgi:cytochrome c biogenesis protein CcmG, thiol:disulfide interchange protein DsbE
MSPVLHLGPLALATDRLAAVAAVWLFVAVGSRRRIGGETVSAVPLAAATGFLMARLSYVAAHLSDFEDAPFDILKVWQGGFHPMAGIFAASVVLAVKLPAARRFTLIVLLIATSGSWYIVDRLSAASNRSPFALQSLRLTTLNGTAFNTESRRQRSMVINLWADWCPPCRREMPTLAKAAREHPGIDFLFVNQGDDQNVASRLPRQHSINPANVLLDRRAQISANYGGALPTTIFVDPEGQVRSIHSGEISRAAITDKLNLIKEPRT